MLKKFPFSGVMGDGTRTTSYSINASVLLLVQRHRHVLITTLLLQWPGHIQTR